MQRPWRAFDVENGPNFPAFFLVAREFHHRGFKLNSRDRHPGLVPQSSRFRHRCLFAEIALHVNHVVGGDGFSEEPRIVYATEGKRSVLSTARTRFRRAAVCLSSLAASLAVSLSVIALGQAQRRGSGWLREFREVSSRVISRIRLLRAAQETRSMKSWDSLAS
jgi:hypothetical protein